MGAVVCYHIENTAFSGWLATHQEFLAPPSEQVAALGQPPLVGSSSSTRESLVGVVPWETLGFLQGQVDQHLDRASFRIPTTRRS